MRFKSFLFPFILLLSVSFISACGKKRAASANIEYELFGHWKINFKTVKGERKGTMIITQSGNKINGTMLGIRGKSRFEGILNGDNLLVKGSYKNNEYRYSCEWKLVKNGDEMRGFYMDMNKENTGATCECTAFKQVY